MEDYNHPTKLTIAVRICYIKLEYEQCQPQVDFQDFLGVEKVLVHDVLGYPWYFALITDTKNFKSGIKYQARIKDNGKNQAYSFRLKQIFVEDLQRFCEYMGEPLFARYFLIN